MSQYCKNTWCLLIYFLSQYVFLAKFCAWLFPFLKRVFFRVTFLLLTSTRFSFSRVFSADSFNDKILTSQNITSYFIPNIIIMMITITTIIKNNNNNSHNNNNNNNNNNDNNNNYYYYSNNNNCFFNVEFCFTRNLLRITLWWPQKDLNLHTNSKLS